jgi:hypothetical protein
MIKTDDPDQKAADQRALDKAAAEIVAERESLCNAFYNDIIANMPDDLTLAEVSGVFLRLLAVGIMQVHDRVKSDAVKAARTVGETLPGFVEREWGSPGHQKMLGTRAKEVN